MHEFSFSFSLVLNFVWAYVALFELVWRTCIHRHVRACVRACAWAGYVSNISILHIVCGCVCIEYLHTVFTHDINTIHAYDTHKDTPKDTPKDTQREKQTQT